MRPACLPFVASILLALCAPLARPQEVLETKSGSRYEGRVLSNDGTSVEIETTDGATMKVPYEHLTPQTQYRLQSAQAGPDGKSQLALAEWCVDRTLYEEAKDHYRKALAADASMADTINASVVVARRTAANELLARGKALQASNQKQEARRVLSLLVQELPLEDASKEAAQLLADDTSQRKQQTLSRKPKAAAATAPDTAKRESGEDFSEATRTLFQPIVESYHKMLDATHDGLVKGGNAGIKEFEKALKEGEKIGKAAEKLRPQSANDAEITEALVLVDEKLEEALVDARVNIVDSYLLRNSYNQASDVVNEGLASYPKNERLLAAKNRVTAAASGHGGGDWVIVGGGGGLRR